MRATFPNKPIAILLRMLDEAYDHRAWHGTNLRGSLRGLNARQAAWRPAPRRHNIWEEAVHTAYWKYAVWRRLTGEKRGSFALEGSNWFARPADPATEAAYAGLLSLPLFPALSEDDQDRVVIALLDAVGTRRTAGGGTRFATTPARDLQQSRAWLERARAVIPMATQTASKL